MKKPLSSPPAFTKSALALAIASALSCAPAQAQVPVPVEGAQIINPETGATEIVTKVQNDGVLVVVTNLFNVI